MGSVEQMLSALHKASASLDVKLARWHESIHQSLEDGDQEPWPEDLPLPEFNPLRPSVNVPGSAAISTPGNDSGNDAGNDSGNDSGSDVRGEPVPRASGTRRRRRPRPAR